MSMVSNSTDCDLNVIEVKDDESFTEILSKDLDVSIEEGELSDNSNNTNPRPVL